MSLALVNARFLVSGMLSKPSMLLPATLLAGGGAASGLVLVEIQQNYQISNQFKKGWEWLAQFFKSQSGDSSSNAHSSAWLQQVGQFFSRAYDSSSQWVVSSGDSLITALKWIFSTSSQIELEMLKDLKKSLGDSAELKDLTKNLFTNAPNFAKFWADKQDRQVLTDLFGSDKLSKTQEALKVLAGIEKHKSFQVEQGVSVYLMKELVRDPKNISKKVARFVDFVERVNQKNPNSTDGQAQDSANNGSNQPYVLTKTKLQGFLEQRKEAAQDGWELGFLLEVGAKQKGVELGPLPSSAISAVFDLLDFLSSKSSESTQQTQTK